MGGVGFAIAKDNYEGLTSAVGVVYLKRYLGHNRYEDSYGSW